MTATPEEQAEFLEKALTEGTMPDWAILAAIGPDKLSEKGKLLTNLNMRQNGYVPAANLYKKGRQS